jgi:hypothetical protein
MHKMHTSEIWRLLKLLKSYTCKTNIDSSIMSGNPINIMLLLSRCQCIDLMTSDRWCANAD